ncbi:uncharacterized protein K444DRAFT_241945 [Hyaloscypha bicolor E]|uniref:Uncharacterized protein n=1 Tax=Hyaloscypha bicolor E TaxID=1095630 RepID=A0A2J6SM10_9HELO|nr:uncharacterized protein K444DRAFT_241945 [Hyaloscypha bicolor E]PMD51806.1 hypothetical protein K444DRAFT_241945 [Hyaloscypha bicolor E]
MGFDGVVAERLLAGRGGRGPLDLRNGKGPPAWRKGRRRCRQGATCHGHCTVLLARSCGLEAGGEANLVCFCRGYQYLEIILGCKPTAGGDCEISSTSKLWGWAPGQTTSTPRPMPTRPRDCPDRLPIIQSGCPSEDDSTQLPDSRAVPAADFSAARLRLSRWPARLANSSPTHGLRFLWGSCYRRQETSAISAQAKSLSDERDVTNPLAYGVRR